MKSNVHRDDVVYITTETVTKTTTMPKIVLKKRKIKWFLILFEIQNPSFGLNFPVFSNKKSLKTTSFANFRLVGLCRG